MAYMYLVIPEQTYNLTELHNYVIFLRRERELDWIKENIIYFIHCSYLSYRCRPTLASTALSGSSIMYISASE